MRAGGAEGTFGKEARPSAVLEPATYRPVPSGAVSRPRGRSAVPSNAVAGKDGYTVAGLIRRLSSSQPDLEMLAQGDRRRTWAEEFAVACQVAQAMRRDGVGAGDRVAFLDRNGIAYFDFLFGGALIGAVNVAVNWRLSPAEMAAIIEDSGAARAGHPYGLRARTACDAGSPSTCVASSSSARVPSCPMRVPFASRSGSPGVPQRIPVMSEASTRSACSSTHRAPRGSRRGSC